MKSNILLPLETHLMCFFLFRTELFNRYTKVTSKTCSTMLSDLSGRCQTYTVYRTSLCLCGFIVFSQYILQNPQGKSNNSMLLLNSFLHKKQDIV